MKTRGLRHIIGFIVLAIFAAGVASAQPKSAVASGLAPAALVKDLYKQHDLHHGPFFQTKSRSIVNKYFTKGLGDLIWKDATTADGEVGALDGDPLYNAQDVEIKQFAIGAATVKADKATVVVQFTNFGKKQKIIYRLEQVNKVWKIDDIDYGAGQTLKKWLSE